jgi:hypothetical protein
MAAHSDWGSPLGNNHSPDSFIEEHGGGAFGAGHHGDVEGFAFHDDLDDEDLDSEPLDPFEELGDAQAALIPIALRAIEKRRRRPAGSVSKNGYITHEDFEEGIERKAFLLIYGHAFNLFEGVKHSLRSQAIEFFFSAPSDDRLTFDDAAAAISSEIRTDVLRLRIVYEFWLRWWILRPFDQSSLPVPELIKTAALIHAGEEGQALVSEIWYQPGVEAKEAILRAMEVLEASGKKSVNAQSMIQALSALIKSDFLVSPREREGENGEVLRDLYVTGRNPALAAGMAPRGEELTTRMSLDRGWSEMF